MAKALERPFLLLKDMDALKRMRQPDLFRSLKRDLALVSSSACFNKSVFLCFLPFFFRSCQVGKPRVRHQVDRGGEGAEEH